MLLNYLKISLRDIKKQKIYSLINILGLAIGIAGTLLILSYVFNELSYESMHKKADRIYRVAMEFGKGSGSMKLAGIMPALGPAVKNDIPEIENSVRLRVDRNAKIEAENQQFEETNFFFADPSIFNIFSFKLMQGDPSTVLNQPYNVVISQAEAEKYFKDENPIGKTIKYNGKYDLTVTGILQNVTENTQIKCDLICSYKTLEIIQPAKLPWNQFGQDYTYILLKKSSNVSSLPKKLDEILSKNTNTNFASLITFHIQHLKDIYFNSRFMGELSAGGNKNNIYIFSFAALLVLIISCFNFINLSTARSFNRIKEVGVRKVLGAGKNQLILQFLSEAFLLTIIAAVLSLIVFELFFPVLTDFLGTKINFNPLLDYQFYILAVCIIIFVTALSGLYPAFLLSRYKPVQAVKGILNINKSGFGFRKTLVIIQFFLSISLITGSLVIFKQLSFAKNSDLGFNKENVLLLPFAANSPGSFNKYKVLRNELLNNANIKTVSGAYTVPGENSNEQQSIRKENTDNSNFTMMRAIGADYDFVNTLGLKIKDGRNFSRNFATDSSSAILLNESAVKKLNLKNPIGKIVYLPGGKEGSEKAATIIGVVKDFHLESLHNKIEPLFIYLNPKRFYTVAVKIEPQNIKSTISFIKSTWEKVLPNKEFSYTFLEDNYNQLYSADEKMEKIFSIFTAFAILIACLGLFGLISFSTEQRTKEIGVRKVLGASIFDIVKIFTNNYLKLILIAIIIASPVSYYLLNIWLQDFAYRIDISIWFFILSGIIVLLIAVLTVIYQIIKAATVNPVKSLRYE